MDIREVSQEEKDLFIDRVLVSFNDIRKFMEMLETDMESKDLMIQASSVWISGQFCTWFDDFVNEIKKLDQTRKSLKDFQDEIKNVVEENKPVTLN